MWFDLRFDVSLLPLLAMVLTGLVKGYYNLEEEPGMHLGRIMQQLCLTSPGVNSGVKWLFGLHISPHKYIHMAARFNSQEHTRKKNGHLTEEFPTLDINWQ